METGAQQHESGRLGSAALWEESPSVPQGAECHANLIHKGITGVFSQRDRISFLSIVLMALQKNPPGLFCENSINNVT